MINSALLRLPYAPGESPFKARGSIYNAGLEYYDRVVPGGQRAVIDALDPALQAFSRRTFLAPTLYDALPATVLTATAAKLAGQSFSEMQRGAGGYAAERDINTLYRVMLHMAPVSTVAVRLAKIAMRYFDFGEVEAELIADRVCQATYQGVPEPLSPWLVASIEGFTPVALRKAGAKSVQVTADPPISDGTTHGVVAVRLVFRFLWT